jgi:hypothetical protein
LTSEVQFATPRVCLWIVEPRWDYPGAPGTCQACVFNREHEEIWIVFFCAHKNQVPWIYEVFSDETLL